MKNLNLKDCGLVELNKNEKLEIMKNKNIEYRKAYKIFLITIFIVTCLVYLFQFGYFLIKNK